MDTAIIRDLSPLAPWLLGFGALAVLGWVLAPLVLWRTPKRKVEDAMRPVTMADLPPEIQRAWRSIEPQRPVGGWGVGPEPDHDTNKREHI